MTCPTPLHRSLVKYVVEFDEKDIGRLRSLTDGKGRPAWAPAMVLNEPDTLLGHPLTPVEQSGEAGGS